MNHLRLEKGLIHTSGKMVLLDKLLPKLRSEGHKVRCHVMSCYVATLRFRVMAVVRPSVLRCGAVQHSTRSRRCIGSHLSAGMAEKAA